MRLASLALAAVLGLGSALATAAQKTVDVGDVPEYEFSKELVNGRGLKSLADFRGKPLLVEFWGTR
jgi:hypothetical protein